VTCIQVLASKLSTNAKFARFKFKDFSRIFKHLICFQALSRALKFLFQIPAFSRISQARYEPCQWLIVSCEMVWWWSVIVMTMMPSNLPSKLTRHGTTRPQSDQQQCCYGSKIFADGYDRLFWGKTPVSFVMITHCNIHIYTTVIGFNILIKIKSFQKV